MNPALLQALTDVIAPHLARPCEDPDRPHCPHCHVGQRRIADVVGLLTAERFPTAALVAAERHTARR